MGLGPAKPSTGTYVDPAAGREVVRSYAERWRLAQVHRPTTAELVEVVLRRHVYPLLGDRPLSSVLPTDIRRMVRIWSDTAAPSTVETRYRVLAQVFNAAVADRRITTSPCVGIALPRKTPTRVVPLATDVVRALENAAPRRYRAMVTLAAGTACVSARYWGSRWTASTSQNGC